MSDVAITDLSSGLRSAIAGVTRRMRALRADGDLGYAAVAVLGVLVKQGPLTLTALSERERVTPASASQSVNRLAADGLVVRSPDSADGRRVLLSATADGRARYEVARGPAHAWLESALDGLPERDRRTLERAAGILERIATQ